MIDEFNKTIYKQIFYHLMNCRTMHVSEYIGYLTREIFFKGEFRKTMEIEEFIEKSKKCLTTLLVNGILNIVNQLIQINITGIKYDFDIINYLENDQPIYSFKY